MTSELLSTAAAWWWSTIAVLAVQGALVLSLVAVVDLALPRRVWPQVRLAMWTLALVKLALPPDWGSPMSLRWSGFEGIDPSLTSWSHGFVELAGSLVVLWIVGVLGFLAVITIRYRRVRRVWMERTESRPDLVEAHRLHQLARRAGCRLPAVRWTSSEDPMIQGFVFGLLRPTVVLSRRLAPRDLEIVLLHELGHLRRRDLWWAAAELGMQAIYWFHPMVWWARQRTAMLREQSCDRFVARVLADEGEDPQRYRSTLLRLAAARWEIGPVSTGGLGFVRPRSGVLLRLALLESFRAERVGLRRLVTAGVLATLVAFGWPAAQRAEQRAELLADVIRRPPGSLQLRYLVLQRLAEEQARREAEEGKANEDAR